LELCSGDDENQLMTQLTSSEDLRGARPGIRTAVVPKSCLKSLIILASVCISACASTSPPSAPVDLEPQARTEIEGLYNCAWYFHLVEEKDLGNEYLDLAIEKSKTAGVRDAGLMSLYSETRQKQKEDTKDLAIAIAQKRREDRGVLALIDSAQEGSVDPTAKEWELAMVEAYSDGCLVSKTKLFPQS